MPATNPLTAARARAEADEIASRAPHRRPVPVRVHGAYPLADMAEIAHDPEDGRLPLIGVLLTAMLVLVLIVALWLILSSVDWRPMLDFISPTAAQARDTGWVEIMEGL